MQNTDELRQKLIQTLQNVFTEQEVETICRNNQQAFGGNLYDNVKGDTVKVRFSSLVDYLIRKSLIESFLKIVSNEEPSFAVQIKKFKQDIQQKELISILNNNFEANKNIYIRAYQASKLKIIIGEKQPENMENIIDNLNTVEDDYYNYMKFVVYLLMIKGEENLDENLKDKLKEWLKDNVNLEIQAKLNGEIEREKEEDRREKNPCLLVAIRSKSDKYVVDAWFIKNLDKYKLNNGSGCEQLINEINTDKKLTDVEEMVKTLIQECINKEILLQEIHIFLPNELINCPVDCWKENENNTIGGMYNVIIRSSERLQARTAEVLRWKKHKDSLNSKFNELANKIFVLGDSQEDKKLQKDFIKQNAIAVKIIPVFCGEQPGKLLFNSFVPFALWIREKRDDINNQDELDQLLNDICLQELLNRVKDKRFDAMYEDFPDNHVGSHLCLFWDDPNLLPPQQMLNQNNL